MVDLRIRKPRQQPVVIGGQKPQFCVHVERKRATLPVRMSIGKKNTLSSYILWACLFLGARRREGVCPRIRSSRRRTRSTHTAFVERRESSPHSARIKKYQVSLPWPSAVSYYSLFATHSKILEGAPGIAPRRLFGSIYRPPIFFVRASPSTRAATVGEGGSKRRRHG